MQARIVPALLFILLIIGGLSGCIKGNKEFAYTTGAGANEVFQFQIHSNGGLTALNPGNSAVGSSPVSVAIRPAGDFAYIANAAGNNVTLLAVNKGNGQLSVPANTSPIPSPTPSNIFNTGTTPVVVVASPAAPFLFVANQGSSDINSFTIDPKTGNLTIINSPSFSLGGAMHPASMAITPKGDQLLVTDPASGLFAVVSIDSKGALSGGIPAQLAAGVTPTFVATEPSGRFVYVADKPNNRVLGFSISGSTLTPIAGSPFATGFQPVAIAASPQGTFLYVANQGSNDVSAYVIDASTGALGPVAGSPFGTGGRGPTFVAASGSFVYVTEQTTNDIAAFALDITGSLTAVPGSPFNVPTAPRWLVLIRQ